MLVHEESKSLLLRTQDVSRIQAVIPRHRLIDIEGHNIAVKHDLDEVRVLRSMGIAAPSPILHYYGWPGKFIALAHQKDTAAMLTLNPRAFVLNETGCVDASTEYLSPTGWRRIDQYGGGTVAQYNPATGTAEQVIPLEYVKRPCTEMIRFKTARGVDQLLSAEHRVAYIASTGTFMVRPAREIETAHHKNKRGWSGRFVTTFKVDPDTCIGLTDEQLRLQVAVIADGYFGSRTNWCVVRLKKERKKQRLRALLVSAGVEHKESMPEYPGAEGFSVFRFSAPLRTKEFGPEFWAASKTQIAIVADELWRWDGSVRKDNAVEFCSTSKASADFAQYCFSTSGRTASLSENENNSWGTKPLYVVHARKGASLLYLKGTGVNADNNVRREPSPDGFKYCFEVPSNFLVLRRNGCIFITGNTMKTASALWAADYLMSVGRVKKCLIAGKLSTLEAVWLKEIFTVLMHRSAVVLHGSKERRLERLAADVDFYIINHEGLAVIQKEIMAREDIDLVICDEYSEYRNHTTSKFELLEKLLRRNNNLRFWGMTATPCPNAPTDAYALTKLISPRRVPQYFGEFKRMTMNQITTYKWAPKPEAYDIAFNAMQPAVRYRKEDCLDLPPVVTEERTCEMSPEQKKAFDRMRLDLVAEARAGVQITAVNAADKINKLRQILCGVVRDGAGKYQEIPHAPRLQVLLECIQEAAAKVIVVVPFKGILQVLEKEVSKHYTCAIMNGDVTPVNRNKIIAAFKNEADPRILLCHPQVMAHGLNLTEADMCIFYAPIYSNDQFQQVVERFNRPGQTRKMTVVRIGAAMTRLEFDIYAALDGKQQGQLNILDMYKRIVS